MVVDAASDADLDLLSDNVLEEVGGGTRDGSGLLLGLGGWRVHYCCCVGE